jgi:glucosylceramidase
MSLNRRRFLKAASATAAAWAASDRMLLQAEAGPVRVWSTFGDKRHEMAELIAWRPETRIAPNAITLDPGALRQQMLGFGAALTDAACYVISQMPPDARRALLDEIFAPDKMAMSVCRTCIGSSDYARTAYSFDESKEPDPELKEFSIAHDADYILPVLQQARQINPELFLFSSPWSPPGWMKANRSLLGGSMLKRNFGPYAQYFLKFLDAYNAAGVNIDAVTVQNEVDSAQDGHMPACLWGQEYEIEFVSKHLGPALRNGGSQTKIWILDHNYNLWGRALDELSEAGVYEYVDGIAWHGYFGDVAAMTRVHDAFPQKSAYWTEGGPHIQDSHYENNWSKWATDFNNIVNNWARSITAWNLALDERGEPNIGPFTCAGTVTVNSSTHKVTRSGQYWAFAHFSRHIRRGARVITSDSIGYKPCQRDGGGVTHAAFRNPDGGMVVVLANRGDGKRVQLALATQALEVELPADSVHTLEWA